MTNFPDGAGAALAPESRPSRPSLADPRFDFAGLRLGQDHSGGRVDKIINAIPVRKPSPYWWFRVHPDPSYHYRTRLLEIKEDNELYMVARELRAGIENRLVSKELHTCITRQGTVFVWSVKLPDETGRLDSWNRSAMTVARVAASEWVRIESNREAAGYDHFEPPQNVKIPDPVWPDLTPEEIWSIAFKHYYIDQPDHPRLLALDGRQ